MAVSPKVEPEQESIREKSVNLVDLAGRVIRASTEAFTDITFGAFRVGTDRVAAVATSLADNINAAVTDATGVAERGVDQLFSVFDTARGDDPDDTKYRKTSTSRSGGRHSRDHDGPPATAL